MAETQNSLPSFLETPATPSPQAPAPLAETSTDSPPHESSALALAGAVILAPFKIILMLLRLPLEILRTFSWVPLAAALYFIWVHGFSWIRELWSAYIGIAPGFFAVALCVTLTVVAVQVRGTFAGILDVLTGRDLPKPRRERNVKSWAAKEARRAEKKMRHRDRDVRGSRPASVKPGANPTSDSQATPKTAEDVLAKLREAQLDSLCENTEAIVRLVKGLPGGQHPLRTEIDNALRTILGRALAIATIEPRPDRRSVHLRDALFACDVELRGLREACEKVFLKALPTASQTSLEEVLRRIQAEHKVLDELGTHM